MAKLWTEKEAETNLQKFLNIICLCFVVIVGIIWIGIMSFIYLGAAIFTRIFTLSRIKNCHTDEQKD